MADIAWLNEDPLGYFIGEMVKEAASLYPPAAVYFSPDPLNQPSLRRRVSDGWSNKDHKRSCDKDKCVCRWNNFVTIDVRGESRTMTNRDLDGFLDQIHWELIVEPRIEAPDLELKLKTL